MTTYINFADIRTRLGNTVLLIQLFDVDASGSVDETPGSADMLAADKLIERSQSIVDVNLGDAYGDLTSGGGVVDEAIKGAQVQILLYERVRYMPVQALVSAYRQGYDDAIKLLARIRESNGLRLKTGANGAASATRSNTLQNSTTVNGDTTLPFTKVANKKESSNF